MLVSIVTPSFNQGRFIERTIQSVLEQDYPHIEYIIMDGGSTDGTKDILKRYGARLKWRSEPDKGQSDAINKGFKMVKGDIVAWLNSDDYYLPGAIRKVVEIFQKEPSLSMVYGDGYVVDEKEEWQVPYGVEPFFDLWKLIHLYDFISQPSSFVRKEALLSAGFLDSNLHYILDWELWIRMARVGKVVYTPEKLSCARVYRQAKTQSGGWKRWREIKNVSRRYGNYRWPPAMFLQVPTGFLRDNKGSFPSPARKVLSVGRWLLYPLTMGKTSGFYQDGYVGGRGFISLPLIKEAKSLMIEVEPVISGKVLLKVNHLEKQRFFAADHPETIEVDLTDAIKREEFLHLGFRSVSTNKIAPTMRHPYYRRVAFRVKDLYLLTRQGKIVRDLGFPNLIGE